MELYDQIRIFNENLAVIENAQEVLSHSTAIQEKQKEGIAKAVSAIKRGEELAKAYDGSGDNTWYLSRWTFLMQLSTDVADTLVKEAFRINELDEGLEAQYRALAGGDKVREIADKFNKEQLQAKFDELKALNDAMKSKQRDFDKFQSVARGITETVEEAEEKISEYEKQTQAQA